MLSQVCKPGKGGILPAAKVTKENRPTFTALPEGESALSPNSAIN